MESELIKERLDKELVIDQLREEFCIEEKARMELKTLLDQKTEEHAHANTLAKKKERKAKNEARRAEEREKMMRDEAQHARNDSDLSKALLEVEMDLRDKGCRVSELKIKTLEKKKKNGP